MTSLPESGQISLLIQQFLQKNRDGKKKKNSNQPHQQKDIIPSEEYSEAS